jgi:hypothetical protein
MSNLNILRHALKLNAFHITLVADEISALRTDIAMFRRAGNEEGAFFEKRDLAKRQRELRNLEDMAKRMKTEIATIFRIARIEKKYLLVFGKLPQQMLTTTHEQEHMLDTLLAERKAAMLADEKARLALH